MATETERRFITAEDVARMLAVSESWVREHTRDRCPEDQQIPHVRMPGSRLIRFIECEVLAWMSNRCKPVR